MMERFDRLLLFSIAILGYRPSVAEVKYKLEELVAPPTTEIRTTGIQALRTNNRGQVLANVFGYLPDGRGAVRPYLYENGVPHRLEVASTYPEIYSGVLNNNGMTVCEQYLYLPDLDYEYLIHQDGKFVKKINPKLTIGFEDLADDGTLVGTYDVQKVDGTGIYRRPATYRNGVRTDLGTFGGRDGYAFGTNNRGQVVGIAQDVTGREFGCIWQDGSISKVTFRGRDAGPMVISDSGWIAGVQRIVDEPGSDLEVFVGRGDTYIGYTVSNAFQYFLSAVNDDGIAVCGRLRRTPFITDGAMVFAGGKAELLEDISDAKSVGWSSLTSASDINKQGDLVGYGIKNGVKRGYIAHPVPEPATWIAFGAGLLAISRRRR
ncbi:MAG: PEP-CTERM sorting domain-containing protein [Chthonomonas sp.]|nr:PEP-CTERM sorting domain-containing protein [Chthonomonas sp.]